MVFDRTQIVCSDTDGDEKYEGQKLSKDDQFVTGVARFFDQNLLREVF